MKRFFNIVLFILLISVSVSCGKDILDVNSNPNSPSESQVDPTLLMPSAQVVFAYQHYGWFNRYTSFLVQHWATSSTQFRRHDRYDYNQTDFNTMWGELYAKVLTDCETIIKQGQEKGVPNWVGCGKIFKAYVYSVMTDLWGDIPFSEALKGAANTTPKYDKQQTIYPALIAMIDEGLASLDLTPGAKGFVGTQDFIYAGNISRWQKFGNSLKLRLFMRQSEVNPGAAAAGIAAIINGQLPIISSNSDDAQLAFADAGQQQNPLAFWLTGRGGNLLNTNPGAAAGDFVASKTLVDIMNANNDPRRPIYFLRPNGQVNFVGWPNGNSTTGLTNAITITLSRIGTQTSKTVFSSNNSPALFMTFAEVSFIRAEAAARGWTGENAGALYQQGITANMQKYNVSGADINTYLAQPQVTFPGNQVDQLNAISREKYVALFCQGVEAYSDWRRRNFPVLPAATSNVTGGIIPTRIPYVQDEVNLNSASLNAAKASFTNPNEILNKVWWDVP